MMESMYDIRQLLKRFGVFVYTGNRIGDVELMESEIRNLYQFQLIDVQTYKQAILLLRSERNNLV